MVAWENPAHGQIWTFSTICSSENDRFFCSKFGLPIKLQMEIIAYQESIPIPLKDAPLMQFITYLRMET